MSSPLSRSRPLVPAACLALAWLAGCPAPDGPERPNVVLVVLDTHRADVLSAYGNPVLTSPTFDALAREGTRYERSFSTSFWTLPAHASLFTSQHPSRHGATSETNLLGSGATTLAEVLREAGYRTGAFVSNPWVAAERGLAQGFDTFEETFRRRPGVAFEDEGAIELARNWIAQRVREGEPFLAFLNLNEAHMPYSPDVEALQRLHPGPRPVDRRAQLRKLAGTWRYLAGVEPLDETDFEILRELYEAEIATTDERLGELARSLRALEILDDTLLVVTADHGENLGEHGLIDHMLSFYETTVRVPLLLRYPPRVPAGRVVEGLVSLTDVAPTILDACGVSPERLPGTGRSLIDPAWEPRELVVAENDRPLNGIKLLESAFPDFDTNSIDGRRRMIRTARHKLIWREIGPDEFYDLETDPTELRDLSSRGSEAQAHLEEALARWMREHDDRARDELFRGHDPSALEQLRALGYIE